MDVVEAKGQPCLRGGGSRTRQRQHGQVAGMNGSWVQLTLTQRLVHDSRITFNVEVDVKTVTDVFYGIAVLTYPRNRRCRTIRL